MSEPPDLNRLRAAFAQPEAAEEPDRCPSVAEIWDGEHGLLPPDRLRAVVEHLAGCSPCAEAWRLALALDRSAAVGDDANDANDAHDANDAGFSAALEALPSSADHATTAAHPRRWRRYTVAASAAAAIVAVVLAVHPDRRPAAAPVLTAQRGGAEPASAIHWLTPDGSVLPRNHALRWSGPSDARYDVSVRHVDSDSVIAAARGLATTEYELPAAALKRAPAGADLKVTLTAHFPDGNSEVQFLELRLP